MSLRLVSMINKINKHTNKKFSFAEVCSTSSCVGWLHRQHSIMKSECELNELLFPSQYRQNGNRKKCVRVALQANKRETDRILTQRVKVIRSEFQIVFSATCKIVCPSLAAEFINRKQ